MSGERVGRLSPERLETVLAYHQTLLADRVRNRAFAAALRARVRPGSAVMDLGAGSGVWGVLAARLGARRVVAVEKDPLLARVIERLAWENGVEDVLRVVEGDSRRLDLPRSFDLIVSETVGSAAFDEDIVPILADARRRFLKPGGGLVPEGLALWAAPAPLPEPLGVRPRIVADASFRSLVVHAPSATTPDRFRPLGRPARLLEVDLLTARPPLPLEGLRAGFRVPDGRRVGCIGVWAELRLAPGVRLATRRASSWGVTYFPVDPLPGGPCRFDLELSLLPRPRWRTTCAAGGEVLVRDYSPLFAYGVARAPAPGERGRKGRSRR